MIKLLKVKNSVHTHNTNFKLYWSFIQFAKLNLSQKYILLIFFLIFTFFHGHLQLFRVALIFRFFPYSHGHLWNKVVIWFLFLWKSCMNYSGRIYIFFYKIYFSGQTWVLMVANKYKKLSSWPINFTNDH